MISCLESNENKQITLLPRHSKNQWNLLSLAAQTAVLAYQFEIFCDES